MEQGQEGRKCIKGARTGDRGGWEALRGDRTEGFWVMCYRAITTILSTFLFTTIYSLPYSSQKCHNHCCMENRVLFHNLPSPSG